MGTWKIHEVSALLGEQEGDQLIKHTRTSGSWWTTTGICMDQRHDLAVTR